MKPKIYVYYFDEALLQGGSYKLLVNTFIIINKMRVGGAGEFEIQIGVA